MNYSSKNKFLIAKLENYIPKIIRNDRVPGLSIALIENSEMIWNKSFGLKKSSENSLIENDTLFEAASLTKPVVAYTALKLHDKGLIDLDTPLCNYLKKPYLSGEPLHKLITARHVLSHSCGFPNWSLDEKLKVRFKPGKRFCYSGEGLVYLQTVIEEVTNEALDVYINNNVFIPLKMENSSLVWLEKYENRTAYPHSYKGEPEEIRKVFQANAAWSLYSNPYDYAKFLIEMLNTDKDLSSKTFEEMLKPHTNVNECIRWGLGWGIGNNNNNNNENAYWHWGDNGSYKAFTHFVPNKKSGIVIMTNGYNGLRTCKKIVNTSVGDYNAFSKFLDALYSS